MAADPFLQRPGQLTPIQSRISAFVDVTRCQTHMVFDTMLNRVRDDRFLAMDDGQREKSRNEKVYMVPVDERHIVAALTLQGIGHPFMLVALLEQWEPPSIDEMRHNLVPLRLYIENGTVEGRPLIPQLAELYRKDASMFLRTFINDVNADAIDKSWKAVFKRAKLSDDDVERQTRIYVNRQFPTVDWTLSNMDSLYSLHVLACAMNTTMYLILCRKADASRAERAAPAITCLPIGPEHGKYSVYIAVQSSGMFCIARPQWQKKVEHDRNPSEDHANGLKTFETRGGKMAIYYSYQTSDGEKEFDRIEGFPVEKKRINEPVLSTKSNDTVLSVHLDMLSFNKDNNDLLLSLLASIADRTHDIKVETVDPITQFTRSHLYALVGCSDKNFLLTRKSKTRCMDAISLQCVGSIKVFDSVVRSLMRNSWYARKRESDLGDIDAFRLLSAHIDTATRDQFMAMEMPLSRPLFLPQTSRWTLADFAESTYAEWLAVASIIRYSIGFSRRVCPFCLKGIRAGNSMLPYYHHYGGDTKELRWVCHQCLFNFATKHDKGDKTTPEFMSLLGVWSDLQEKDLPVFAAFDKSAREDMGPILKVYEQNIEYMRAHPVGCLREAIPLIDSAFSTFQRILAKHYVHGQVNKGRKREDMVLPGKKDMLDLRLEMGVKDAQEAAVQMGMDLVRNADNQFVDVALFQEYLSMRNDVTYSSPQFRLVQKQVDILSELDIFYWCFVDHVLTKHEEGKNEKKEYSMQLACRPEFTVKIETNAGDITVKDYRYDLYPIVSPSHVALSPIASIVTDLDILGVWEYSKLQMVILARRDESGLYQDTFVYIVDIGNVTLMAHDPVYEFADQTKVKDMAFEQSSSRLAVSYDVLKETFVEIIDLSKTPVETVRLAHPVESLVFNDGDLIVVVGDNEVKQLEDNAFTDLRTYQSKVRLASVSVGVVAITEDEVVLMSIDDEEEEEEEEEEEAEDEEKAEDEEEAEEEDGKVREESAGQDNDDHNGKMEGSFPSNVNKLTCPCFATRWKGASGLAFISSPAHPFEPDQTRDGNFYFHELKEPQVFAGKLCKPLVHKTTFSHYQGMVEVDDKPNRSLWNIRLTIAELLPALIAYEFNHRLFCVRSDMSHYYATRRNNFLPAAVGSFYTRTSNAISLHHIEDVVKRHNLRVCVVGFVSQMKDEQVARFIDTIFGTRFVCVDVPGIWVAMRIVGDIAHIILFGKGVSHDDLSAMTAMYRGAHVVQVCTKRLVGTLNFLDGWQLEVPKRHPLREGSPWVQTSMFMPREIPEFNEKALIDFKQRIVGDVSKVPFRESWETSTIDDITVQQDDDYNENSIASKFMGNWQNILQGDMRSVNAAYRAPYSATDGVNIVKEIITTYMTLIEFNDLAISTVLPLCHRKTPDA